MMKEPMRTQKIKTPMAMLLLIVIFLRVVVDFCWLFGAEVLNDGEQHQAKVVKSWGKIAR